jgi:hypothetical protein
VGFISAEAGGHHVLNTVLVAFGLAGLWRRGRRLAGLFAAAFLGLVSVDPLGNHVLDALFIAFPFFVAGRGRGHAVGFAAALFGFFFVDALGHQVLDAVLVAFPLLITGRRRRLRAVPLALSAAFFGDAQKSLAAGPWLAERPAILTVADH